MTANIEDLGSQDIQPLGADDLLADLLGSDPGFLDPHLIAAYGHGGATAVATRMRAALAGAVPSGDRPLQEPYSIRCSVTLAKRNKGYLHGVVDVSDAVGLVQTMETLLQR